MRWLCAPSPSAVAGALRAVAPELSRLPVNIPAVTSSDDPIWHSTSGALGEDYFVKFAWSEPAARRVLHEIRVAVVDSIDLDRAGVQIAQFLAALHGDESRRRAEAVTGAVPAWYPLVTTSALRGRFGRWVTPRQQREVVRWCDWADAILAEPRPHVLVHGDLHGDNQVWHGGELKAVLDFENAGAHPCPPLGVRVSGR